MILSHRHRFIYVKTYKTASSSVEAALSKLLGPDDVITPARADIEESRGDVKAQNYRLDHPLVPKRPLLKRLLRRPERANHPSVGYYHHMPAWRIRAYVGEEIWNSYFKFTFERNPWDRQVSWYWFKRVRRGRGFTFEEFLRDRRRAWVPNFDLYSADDRVVVDFVGRYEEIGKGFEVIADRLKLPGGLDLPHINKSEREADYRNWYKPETCALMAEWYRREIEKFGYGF